MANQIRLKRASGSDPGASDLVTGELAVRTDTAKLFTKKDDNSVAEIGGGITDVVDDTSPQLGGDLQSNGSDIDFADGDKAIFGGGSDLKIYHSGSHSFIQEEGTGSLYIDSNQLYLRQASDDTILFQTISNGEVRINHNGNERLRTTSDGVSVTGDLVTSDDVIINGTTDDESVLRFYDGGAGSWMIRQTNSDNILSFRRNSTNYLQLQANGNVDVANGLDVTGNITVSGTVDGVDIASLNSTVSGKLSNVVEDTSPQLGGDFQSNGHDIKIADATGYDGNNIYMGTGADCRIHHDGSNFSIAEATGDVTIQAADDIFLQPQGGENGIKIIGNGSVELYENSNKKFETTSVGVEITGNATSSIVTLTDGSNIAVDLSSGTHFTVTLGGNRTFTNSGMNTSSSIGSSGSIFIVQDGTGSRTAAFQSDYKFAGGTAPTLSTAANAVDRLDYVVRATNVVHAVVTLDVK